MTARHSDHRAIDGVLAEAPLVDAIGPVSELPREVKLRAVAHVLHHFGDDGCTELSDLGDDTREVLGALFVRPRGYGETQRMKTHAENAKYKTKAKDKGGRRPASQDERYRYPVPLGDTAAAREYRYGVRQWGRAQGRIVHNNGSVQPGLLNAYVEATGHRWNGGA